MYSSIIPRRSFESLDEEVCTFMPGSAGRVQEAGVHGDGFAVDLERYQSLSYSGRSPVISFVYQRHDCVS
jgi:hypothetical protein